MESHFYWPLGKESQKESPKENFKNQSPGLRIVLFGKDEIQKSKLLNFIRGTDMDSLDHQSVKHCSGSATVWKENILTVVKTPDMFHLPKDAVIEEMTSCVSLCPPGPNVLLLLANPSDFTEENRQTLKFMLRLFNQDAFKHLMIINTHKGVIFKLPLNKVFKKCGRKIYNMSDENHWMLMAQIERIVNENNQFFLTLNEESIQSELMRTPLNIVLWGTRRAEKTSAARAILGRTDFHPVSVTSGCVKLKTEVCGRPVSLVELPDLYGRPLETVMKVSLTSVSLCDPEGVHVFMLVLPVGPLTEEDKKEFKTIVNTFGSQVKAFTMTLFTVEADPSAPGVVNYMKKDKDIQELIQSCRLHFVLNIRDKQQIPKLLDSLKKHRADIEHKALSYTTETFAHAQIEKIVQQAELQSLKQSSTTDGDMKKSPESLRVVLLGKTGCGKSSSGNTILGRKEFQAKSSQKSVTQYCEKSHGELNGRRVTVVDTPGLFDTSLSNDEIYEEMIKCISLLAPGPHVFLLVVNIGRFTEEEKSAIKQIKEGFGGNAEKFTIILFTGGDTLKQDNMTIDEYIDGECTDSFQKLIADCGGRYHLFDNRDYKNQTQVSELITKIDAMVKENGGSYYTNEMLQEAEAAIKKQMEKLLKQKEEEMRKELEELKIKHEEEMKAMERKIEEQRAETEKQRKLREKQLEDMKEKIDKEQEERERDQKRREEEERRRKEQEEIQRQERRQKLADLETQIVAESVEKQMTDRKLLETKEELQRERDNWEKQLKDWWEDRYRENEQIRHEEQSKLKKLEEEYKKEKENDEKKRKEEDQLRQQQEEQKRKAMEEEHEKKMKDLKKTYEEEARKKAEEFNDFKEKYKKDYEDLQKKHEKEKKTHEEERKDKDEKYDLLKALLKLKEEQLKKKQRDVIINILKIVLKKRGNFKKITTLLAKQEEKINKEKTEEGQKILQEKHEEELFDLLEKLLAEEDRWYHIFPNAFHWVIGRR